MNQNLSGGNLQLDPRIRLLLVIMLSTVSFWMTTSLTSTCLVILAALLMLASGIYKITFYTLAFYGVFLLLDSMASGIGSSTLSLVIVTLSYFIQKCTTIFMLGAYLSGTTSVTEVICTLETLRLPDQIIIPFAVAMRFMPSIREDFSCLKDSLRVRNIDVSIRGILTHPLQTMEFLVVPILIRSYKTSDELAASAMVRGLGSGRRKTILRPLKFRALDFVALAFILGMIGFLFYLQNTI